MSVSAVKTNPAPVKICSDAEKKAHGGRCESVKIVHFKSVPKAKTNHGGSAKPAKAGHTLYVKVEKNPFGPHQVRESGLGLLNKHGELVGVRTYEASDAKGQEYLETNQKKLGLALIERRDGTRVFVAAGQAKNFITVSTTQQVMEKYEAIVRKHDAQGFFYEALKPQGKKYLDRHPELPQRKRA